MLRCGTARKGRLHKYIVEAQDLSKNVAYIICYLRELVNYRHPGPRRVWKGGSEPQLRDRIRGIIGIRGIRGIRRCVPKYGFVYAKPYFSLSGRSPTAPGLPAAPGSSLGRPGPPPAAKLLGIALRVFLVSIKSQKFIISSIFSGCVF